MSETDFYHHKPISKLFHQNCDPEQTRFCFLFPRNLDHLSLSVCQPVENILSVYLGWSGRDNVLRMMVIVGSSLCCSVQSQVCGSKICIIYFVKSDSSFSSPQSGKSRVWAYKKKLNKQLPFILFFFFMQNWVIFI